MTVNDTLSPYWLRVNGTWVHLEGVAPGWTSTPTRASSEFTSVGGHRYIQVAPRATREWSLSFQFATPEALAALAVAAESDDVLLHDETAARANMLDPQATFGFTPGAPTLEVNGIALRAIDAPMTTTVVVRQGVRYNFTCWTDAVVGTMVAKLDGATFVTAPAGVGPRQVHVAWTDQVGGSLGILIYAGDWITTGLQLVEWDPIAPAWMAGQRTPCPVSVGDPERTQVITSLDCGDDRGMSRDDWTVTIQEVG